ncbi:hypothetical protein DL95DRAFT_467351 [Leptodontidium sp. 2 PMI_412]|nr:hypothetical protein DL95DRAFT_467351 [Leptodontidium sp. 2 PMI_412]
MLGAEIGLVLTIIPLCIAATEHYEDVLRPFKRYRNYSIELELLLSHVSSWDIAEAMVQDCDHPRWKGPDMEEKLSTWLGKSHLACKNTIRLICEDLSNIRKEASFFDTDTKDSAIPTDSSQKKSYKQRIGRKLKWNLSKSQLQRILEDLQYHVEVFRRHTGQASSIMEKRQNIKQKNTTPEKFKTETIAETHIVHKAAVELYQALILACKLHREHKLHFRLETRNCSNNEGSFIRFHLGYIPSLPSSGVRPFWVAVESEYGTTRMTMSNSKLNTGFVPQLGLNNLLKRAYEVPLSTPQKRKKKATDRKFVHFENSAGTPATSPGNKSRNLKSCLLPAFLPPSSEDTPIVTDAIQESAHSPICPIPSMPK